MAWLEHPIPTDRLVLRPFGDADRPFAVRMLTDSTVRAFLGGPLTEAEALRQLDRPVGQRWGSFCVADSFSGQPIGSTLLAWRDLDLEVSVHLVLEAWGRGFGTEALGATLQFGWRATTASSAVAVTRVANARCRRLLEGMGALAEATFPEFGALQVRYRFVRPTIADGVVPERSNGAPC